ncbi:MAG: efflux transporter outer membrane subunit [Acidobacteriaceae bacterium]|nr:efflux transporter outer membrane subunit [Acidobacteriaceae bacterium]
MTGGGLVRRSGKPNLRVARCSAPVVLLLLLLLSGCLVGPNYQRPKVDAPTAYRGAEGAVQQASFADLPWWEIFKDETLKGLVKTALANNYDLGVAVTRVEQARQVAAEARAQYFPAINYQTQISGGKNQFSAINPTSGSSGISGFFLGLASASWEPDVWGRIRRLNESARAQYLATEEARRGVMLTLVSNVSQAYFQVLGLQLQLQIARESAGAFGQSRKLFEQRLQGGVASILPVSRAAADEATAEAQIPELQRQIALTENQISVLLGQNPGPIAATAKLLEEIIPPAVPAGLPSALLERRPDVLSAEQTVRAANAQIGVAKAAYFPTFGLTAFYGKASSPLSAITSHNTNVANAALQAAGPIFEGGALKAQTRQAVAAWQQAKLQYEQTALSAFQDVSNALISREKYDETRIDQSKAVESYQTSVQTSLKRYLAGLSSYYEVLEAQQQLFPAQVALAQTELNRRLVIIQLYLALGGGWNLTDAQWMSASAQPPAQTPPPGHKP